MIQQKPIKDPKEIAFRIMNHLFGRENSPKMGAGWDRTSDAFRWWNRWAKRYWKRLKKSTWTAIYKEARAIFNE